MPNVKKPIVPPGGFAGFSQQTSATQALFGAAVRKKSTRKKRRKVARKKRKTVRRKKRPATRRKTRRKTSGRLVKGSAAAKRRMAQLRRMRKKKNARRR